MEARRYALPVPSKTWEDCNFYCKHQSEAGLLMPRKPSARSQWWWVLNFFLLKRILWPSEKHLSSCCAVLFNTLYVMWLHVSVFCLVMKRQLTLQWGVWTQDWVFVTMCGWDSLSKTSHYETSSCYIFKSFVIPFNSSIYASLCILILRKWRKMEFTNRSRLKENWTWSWLFHYLSL